MRPGSAGQLQLVAGTEAWAKNPEYVTGLETAAAGSLVVGLEMLEWQTFTTWLSSLSTSGIVGHPFLSELFEITNQCSLGPSTRGSYNRVCSSAETMNNVSAAVLSCLCLVLYCNVIKSIGTSPMFIRVCHIITQGVSSYP